MKLFAAVLLVCSAVRGAELGHESLKGIRNVHVLIEDLDAEIQRDGLTDSQLQTDVELRVRTAGLKAENAGPVLYVRVSSILRDELYFYAITVEFHQRAIRYIDLVDTLTAPKDWDGAALHLPPVPRMLIQEKMAAAVTATTWTAGSIGTVGRSKAAAALRQRIHDHIDMFLNDWLGENPK